jgi:fatty-acid desaturase
MIHVQVVLAMQCSVSGMMITAQQLALFTPIMLLFIGVPMSVCLHRYFSHKVLVYEALSY